MFTYILVSRILVSAGQYALPTGYSTPETSRALANFWETVNENYAHIRYGGHLESTSKVVRGWQKGWLHRLPSSVRTVAEYGIGAGLLGQVMLQNYSIAHYVGIDISRRQLGAASKRLESCCQHRYTLILAEEQALRDAILQPFRIDLFVSQAVIQHFPSDKYFASFLAVLSRSGIRYLMLQTRESGAQENDVTRAQVTKRPFLRAHLAPYRMLWHSPTMTNGYVFYWFERI